MWPKASDEYKSLIRAEDWDSHYLRERGLIPTMIELAGDCRDKVMLDAGTGTGWLLESVRPKEAHACDLARPSPLAEGVEFRQEDVHHLSYPNDKFDLVTASLLLIYCQDLDRVLREFHRVSRAGGQLVLSLMHPYFYRTGEVSSDGQFLITEDLSIEREFDFHIGESVGPFKYFYRPLPTYLNSLIETGWRIAEVRDWFIDIEDYRHHRRKGVKSKLQRSGKIPLFSFIKAIKE